MKMVVDNKAIDLKILWGKCLDFIKDNIPSDLYDAWFQSVVPDRCDETSFTLRVPSTGFYEFFDNKFSKLVISALSKVTGRRLNLKYICAVKGDDSALSFEAGVQSDFGKRTEIVNANRVPSPADIEVPQDIDPHLNPQLTFENFVEGKSNELCRAAGLSLAENARTPFNPLFIYGNSGVGKTHLANAIGAKIKELCPARKVLYISAHLFRVQFTDATISNKVNDFINFYQKLDVLIMDDVQEFANWEKTQNTFFHIFNHLLQAGKQIIMTCDKEPSEICGLEERLLTRFKSGLVAKIEKPNFELRRDILKNKIDRDGLGFSDDVIDYIAHNVDASVRELEGILVSLVARSILLNKTVDVDLASHLIKHNEAAVQKSLTIDVVVDTICKYFKLNREIIYAKTRKREYAQARQIAMYLSKKYLNIPLSRIGQQIAGRDHSTVIYSCHKVQDLMAVDKAFKADVESIEELLHKVK